MVITVTVVGPFEEEEEGTDKTSEVIKVEGEILTTPNPLSQGMTRDRNDSPISGQQNKTTHTVYIV